MSFYDFKNILITGAAGFIGSNFIHAIFKQNSQVKIISLDKLTYAGNKKNLEDLPSNAIERHFFIHGDICDRKLVDKILHKYQIDTIVHFAAESHVDRSIQNPADFMQTNVLGTFTLLEAARNFWQNEKKWAGKQCRFHHISTDEVYGELQAHDVPFTETSPYAPSSPYSASKAASDHLVRAYFRTYKLPITISNCSNNYGRRQHDEKMIPTVMRCCFEQKPIPVYGDGSNIRDWLYVEDHCQAIALILAFGTLGETYNIGGNAEKDNLTLVKTICQIFDEKRPQFKPHAELIAFVADRPGHDLRYAIDCNKIKKELGWKPQHSFLNGLLTTIDNYIKQCNALAKL